jgi:hypothetical protein
MPPHLGTLDRSVHLTDPSGSFWSALPAGEGRTPVPRQRSSGYLGGHFFPTTANPRPAGAPFTAVGPAPHEHHQLGSCGLP